MGVFWDPCAITGACISTLVRSAATGQSLRRLLIEGSRRSSLCVKLILARIAGVLTALFGERGRKGFTLYSFSNLSRITLTGVLLIAGCSSPTRKAAAEKGREGRKP